MKKKLQIILAVGLMASFLTGCSNKDKLELKAESLDIEYGENISDDPANYLTNEDEDFLKGVQVEINAENEEEKNYPAIGEYEVNLTYEDQTEKVNVKVKDTTAPVFKDFSETLEFNKGQKPSADDYITLFSVDDLSSVVLTIDDSQVDFDKVGEYNATVTATDSSGNATTLDIKIRVVENGAANHEVSASENTSVKTATSGSNKTTSNSSTTKPSSSTSSNTTSGSSSNSANNSSSSNKTTSSSTTKPSSSTSSNTANTTSGSSNSSSSTTKPSSSTSSNTANTTSGSSNSSSSTTKPSTSTSGSNTSTGSASSSSSSSSSNSESTTEWKIPMTDAEILSYCKSVVDARNHATWSTSLNVNNSGYIAYRYTKNTMKDEATLKEELRAAEEDIMDAVINANANSDDPNYQFYFYVKVEHVSDTRLKVYYFYNAAPD